MVGRKEGVPSADVDDGDFVLSLRSITNYGGGGCRVRLEEEDAGWEEDGPLEDFSQFEAEGGYAGGRGSESVAQWAFVADVWGVGEDYHEDATGIARGGFGMPGHH